MNRFALWWGVLGVVAILLQAVWRLGVMAIQPFQQGDLAWWHIGLYGVSIVFNGYAEGYRSFQSRFSPRVVARGLHLARNPKSLFVALAPFYCMALFYATRRRLIVSWALLVGIICVVIAVRQLAQPWRGIIDAGVVVGLLWGVISILVYFVRALRGHDPGVDPETP